MFDRHRADNAKTKVRRENNVNTSVRCNSSVDGSRGFDQPETLDELAEVGFWRLFVVGNIYHKLRVSPLDGDTKRPSLGDWLASPHQRHARREGEDIGIYERVLHFRERSLQLIESDQT